MEQTERSLSHLKLDTQPEFGPFPGARYQISKMEQGWYFLNIVADDEKFDDGIWVVFGGHLQKNGQKCRLC